MTLHTADPLRFTPLTRPGPLPGGLGDVLFPGGQAAHVLLDGAAIPGLAEVATAAGGSALSLYSGDAMEDAADSGPWLIRLEAGSKLSAQMLCKSEAPWHLWGHARAVFIVSDASTDDLAKHFKRFLRMRQPSGAFTLYRFYDGRVLDDFLAGALATAPARAARFFARAAAPTEPLIRALLVQRAADDDALTPYHYASPLPADTGPAQNLDATDMAILQAAADTQLVERVGPKLQERVAKLAPDHAEHAPPFARWSMDFIRHYGGTQSVDIERDVMELALCAMLLGPNWQAVAEGPLMTDPLVPMSHRVAMLRDSLMAGLAAVQPDPPTGKEA